VKVSGHKKGPMSAKRTRSVKEEKSAKGAKMEFWFRKEAFI